MSGGFVFQSRPSGDRHITIFASYMAITDGSTSAAALLFVLEFMAKSAFTETFDYALTAPPIPSVIDIGVCSNSRLVSASLGAVKGSELPEKLRMLSERGLVSLYPVDSETTGIMYHHKNVEQALILGGAS